MIVKKKNYEFNTGLNRSSLGGPTEDTKEPSRGCTTFMTMYNIQEHLKCKTIFQSLRKPYQDKNK